MKILFVSARLPFPTIEGHQLRAFGVLKQLSKSNDIYLLSLLREGEFVDLNNELGDTCVSIESVNIKNGFLNNVFMAFKAIRSNLPLVVTKY
ncbi:MAG: hypothetical protein QM500_14715, partial [Methylococcales bacterium]